MIYYTPDHEWIEIENGTGKVGVSPHAIEQLGDIVFVELPEKERSVMKASLPCCWMKQGIRL